MRKVGREREGGRKKEDRERERVVNSEIYKLLYVLLATIQNNKVHRNVG